VLSALTKKEKEKFLASMGEAGAWKEKFPQTWRYSFS
jgi:hypothetical protein